MLKIECSFICIINSELTENCNTKEIFLQATSSHRKSELISNVILLKFWLFSEIAMSLGSSQ
ncbi:MAG: hypothetical protein HWN67_17505 [Candidatus Helarchaeota archaeon]|nr:hypothetical protein [Candidatus Helarchaeota archaeon]